MTLTNLTPHTQGRSPAGFTPTILAALLWACAPDAGPPKGEPGADSGQGAGEGSGEGGDGAEGAGEGGPDSGEPDAVDADGDGYALDVDCDDSDPAVNPGAEELPGDGLDNDCDPSTCGGAGFSPTAADYALPSGYPSLSFISTQREARCADALPTVLTRDLNGDRRPDLIIQQSPCGDAEPGDQRWAVHLGGEAGFAEVAVDWPLPEGFPANTFVSKGAAPDCAAGRPGYNLLDINGDQRDDLVVTAPACGAGEPGLRAWDVYLNEGAGFAPAPTAWALPEGAPDGVYRQVGGPPDCASGRPGFSLIDLDRDRRPELVHWAEACGGATPGEGQWDRFANLGDGFAPEATPWALPPGRFPALSTPADCGAGRLGWSTLDLNGDRLLDLVVTEGCAGDGAWRLYPGEAEGFAAEGALISLPEAIPTGSLSSPSGPADCALGRPAAGLVDLGGGPAPELVLVAEACGGGPLGEARWESHRFTPAGYTSAPLALALPEGYPAASFAALGAERSCADEQPGWLLQDYSGDGVPDVVVTAGPCLEGELGRSAWAVHAGSCPP